MIRNENPQSLRVIKTARDRADINYAATKGYKPLIKKVEPSEEIRSKYSVIQNKKTGTIQVISDYRSEIDTGPDSDFETVIGWTDYYPHTFKSPFAAYLIPADIEIGERVFIEDLIEDYIGGSWNQGDVFRLKSAEAIWNGTDLVIQYAPENRRDFVG